MERTGAELVVECLKVEGVRHIFGVTGSSLLPILDILYDIPEIQYVMTQHEQGASYMAGSYARTSGKPGVVLVHHGVGIANGFIGIVTAYYTSSPMIILSTESSTHDYGRGASNRHELDQIAVMKPVTKLAERVERVERIPEMMQRAFRIAITGRPGPVYLGLPGDVLRGRANVDILDPGRYRTEARPTGGPKQIRLAADLLAEAKRPAILAGGGVNSARANRQLLELAEILAAPVAGSQGCKGIIPEDHHLALGVVGYHGTVLPLSIFREADVILAVGCTFSTNTTADYTDKVLTRATKVIHVDIDPGEIGKNCPVELGIIGDAQAVLEALIQEMKERKVDRRPVEDVPRIKKLLEMKEQQKEHWGSQRTSDAVPIQPPRLLADLRQALPRDAIVGAGGGGTHQWFEFAFEALAPNNFGRGWDVLGEEYCAALGAQVASPGSLIVVLCGDGSFMMCLQEMATAVAYQLPVLAIICRNEAFGNIKHTQMTRYGGRIIGTDLPIPNLSDVAKNFGLYSERVTEPGEIIPAVGRALASKKPSLVEVVLDSSVAGLKPETPLDMSRNR